MRTVSFLNLKGGVGKTACSVNLAAAIAASGRKCLLVDLDPQGSATDHLIEDQRGAGVASVLMGSGTISDSMIDLSDSAGFRSGLYLLPSEGFQLSAAEVSLQARGSKNRLRLSLDSGTIADVLNTVVVDSGPGLDFLWYNALYASSVVVCPVELQMAALQGLRRFQELLDFAKEEDGLNPLVYYLPTNNDGRLRESRELLAVLVDQFGAYPDGKVLPSIHYSSTFSKAYGQRQTVLEYAPSDRVSEDCRVLAEIILSIL